MVLAESQDKHFIFFFFKNWVLDKVSLTATKEVIIFIIIGLLDDTMILYDISQKFSDVTDIAPNYFLSKQSVKEIMHRRKAKESNRTNIYNSCSCGWYT